MSSRPSEFSHLFAEQELVDRFAIDGDRAVDVIIPIIHTNELWRTNLRSIYREIPVSRLLLADGGCKDDSLEVAREFPRVQVLDHREVRSLGYSLRKLIEEVRTEWFIYLHSDIFLPPGWFDAMEKGRGQYDWFESGQTTTILARFTAPTLTEKRAYSGAQMGRRRAFDGVLPVIDDDYLYRNEDIILASLVERTGHRYGKIAEAFCEHQVMFKESPWERRVKHVYVLPEIGREEEIRAALTYVKGIVKYLPPEESAHLVAGLKENLRRLAELGVIDDVAFAEWVAATSPTWSEIFPLPQDQLPPESPPADPAMGTAGEAAVKAEAQAASAPRFLDVQLMRLRHAGNVYRSEGAMALARRVYHRLGKPLR